MPLVFAVNNFQSTTVFFEDLILPMQAGIIIIHDGNPNPN